MFTIDPAEEYLCYQSTGGPYPGDTDGDKDTGSDDLFFNFYCCDDDRDFDFYSDFRDNDYCADDFIDFNDDPSDDNYCDDDLIDPYGDPVDFYGDRKLNDDRDYDNDLDDFYRDRKRY
ncbi:MAG: hypothetical protein M0R76_00495 [Proteobacteria bacterium]|nr:hypothetical protein [Pseudomonadota bacterium]